MRTLNESINPSMDACIYHTLFLGETLRAQQRIRLQSIIVDHFQSKKSIIMHQKIKLKTIICIACVNAMLAMFASTDVRNLTNNARASVVKSVITEGGGDNETEGLSLLSSYPRKLSLPAGTSARRPGYNDLWLVASIKKNVAVTIIPKVMCSSIRHQMSLIECGARTRCSEARADKTIRHANISNMTRVLIVRDPFERAYSAYKNSANKHIKIGACQSSPTTCTFDQWVDELAHDTKVSFRNEHFTPQVKIAQMKKMHYHYLLRISSSVDQEFFWNDLLGMGRSRKENESKKNNHTLTEMFNSIHFETFEKLAAMYDADLKLWKRALKHWTPRQTGEVTMFDLYKAARQIPP
jgi:hypothetical protein